MSNLSAETRQALADVGIPSALVDTLTAIGYNDATSETRYVAPDAKSRAACVALTALSLVTVHADGTFSLTSAGLIVATLLDQLAA